MAAYLDRARDRRRAQPDLRLRPNAMARARALPLVRRLRFVAKAFRRRRDSVAIRRDSRGVADRARLFALRLKRDSNRLYAGALGNRLAARLLRRRHRSAARLVRLCGSQSAPNDHWIPAI